MAGHSGVVVVAEVRHPVRDAKREARRAAHDRPRARGDGPHDGDGRHAHRRGGAEGYLPRCWREERMSFEMLKLYESLARKLG